MTLNREFMFVYSPSVGLYPEFGRRFLISANRLDLYLGRDNALKVVLAALRLKYDKTALKFRKYGKIDIYLK